MLGVSKVRTHSCRCLEPSSLLLLSRAAFNRLVEMTGQAVLSSDIRLSELFFTICRRYRGISIAKATGDDAEFDRPKVSLALQQNDTKCKLFKNNSIISIDNGAQVTLRLSATYPALPRWSDNEYMTNE